MKFLRKLLAQKRINKALENDDRDGHIGLDKLKSLILVVNLDEAQRVEEHLSIKDNLKKACPNLNTVFVIGITRQKPKKFPSSFTSFAERPNTLLVNGKNISFAYKLIKIGADIEKKVFRQEHDLLIVLNNNDQHTTINRLQAEIKSKFKIGYYSQNNQDYFDFMLHTEKGSKAFIADMLHYLNKIS